MQFAVCLIAKNEQETLPRLLSSLKEFQDKGGKVLLLDTGSTDDTIKVAESLSCEVHAVGDMFIRQLHNTVDETNKMFVVEGEDPIVNKGDRVFDYASARNYIVEKSPLDMVAMPDCDEIFTKLDLEKINEAIKNGAEQLEYNFVYAHDEYGNESMKFMHCKFYNRKKLKWVGIIHEV